MEKIIFSGWNNNFNKVSMDKLLRDKGGLSLSEAKKAVDSILANETVCIEIEGYEIANHILNESIKFGALARIETSKF